MALSEARVPFEKRNKDGSMSTAKRYKYLCSKCDGFFPIKDVQVDHIDPVGPTPDFADGIDFIQWARWLSRLFCSEENLTVLCITCHADKTKKDRSLPYVS